MNTRKMLGDRVKTETQKVKTSPQKLPLELQTSETEEMTAGQRLADLLATKVGSWSFLTVQTSILTAWVGLNLMPGIPHWDNSPFILLNLVFSFASAYTAPIVLMSQNRQSDIDRKKAERDHQVNLRAEFGIELLHEKMDSLQTQHLQELTQLVKEQQRCLHEIQSSMLPAFKEQQHYFNKIKSTAVPIHTEQPQYFTDMKENVLPAFTDQHQYLDEAKMSNGKLPNGYSAYIPFNNQPIETASKPILEDASRH